MPTRSLVRSPHARCSTTSLRSSRCVWSAAAIDFRVFPSGVAWFCEAAGLTLQGCGLGISTSVGHGRVCAQQVSVGNAIFSLMSSTGSVVGLALSPQPPPCGSLELVLGSRVSGCMRGCRYFVCAVPLARVYPFSLLHSGSRATGARLWELRCRSVGVGTLVCLSQTSVRPWPRCWRSWCCATAPW